MLRTVLSELEIIESMIFLIHLNSVNKYLSNSDHMIVDNDLIVVDESIQIFFT